MRSLYKSVGGAALALVMASGPALATDGYFANGSGARQKALGGAGVADGNDATTASLNPAGMVNLDRSEFSMSVSAFSPIRQSSFAGPNPFGVTGTVKSGMNWFAVPNMAYVMKTNGLFDAVGFSVVGNGGMNTKYPVVAPAGVFGAGNQAGVNLEQAIISASVAKSFGNVSIGISPAVVRQTLRIRGVQAFGQPDLGTDISWGYGLRAGLQWKPLSNVRFGVSGSTRSFMTRFNRYSTILAQRGDFDIPAHIQAGVAVDLTPSLTLMADYKHIWYSEVRAIANPSTNIFFGGFPFAPPNLGTGNGAGFGWSDVDVIKIGLEYDMTDALTLRAGYSYNTSPISARDVTLNVLAPATVQHHITAGLGYDINNNWSLELAGMYAPPVSITGPNLLTGPFGGNDTIRMYQTEVTGGIKYKF